MNNNLTNKPKDIKMVHSIIVSKDTGEMLPKCITAPLLTRRYEYVEGIRVMIVNMKNYEVRMFNDIEDRDRYLSDIDV